MSNEAQLLAAITALAGVVVLLFRIIMHGYRKTLNRLDTLETTLNKANTAILNCEKDRAAIKSDLQLLHKFVLMMQSSTCSETNCLTRKMVKGTMPELESKKV